ncbi:MAG TPA: DUF5067 domain-containing protein [Microbacteriaceae bacterium]|nr:DUF5067 domain-containing protein [Microbacteriaceae bacterium]
MKALKRIGTSKSRPAIFGALMLSLTLGLTACGSGAGETVDETVEETIESAPETGSYDVKTFQLGNFYEVEIYNDDVVFDSEKEVDVLLVYLKATHIGDDPWPFSSAANVNAFDDSGEKLRWSRIEDGSGTITDLSAADEELENGESVDLVYGWELTDYNPVTVNFGGFTASVEDTDIVFEVEGRQTEEAKAVAADIEEKKSAGGVEIEGSTINLADGWYADSSTDKKAKLKNDDLGKGYVEVSFLPLAESAEAERAKLNDNFGGDKPLDSVTINGQDFLRLTPNDTQFILLADTSAGNVIKVYGMHFAMDEVTEQLELIEIN